MICQVGAEDTSESVVEAHFDLVGAGMRSGERDTRSGSNAPVEGLLDILVLRLTGTVHERAVVALVRDAITDLRTEVEEPTAFFTAEIQVHHERDLDIMEIAAVTADGVVMLRPSAMQVVEFDLQGAVLMSRVAEHQPAVAAKHAGFVDGHHVAHRRAERYGAGSHATMHAKVVLRRPQTRLGLHTYRAEQCATDDDYYFSTTLIHSFW